MDSKSRGPKSIGSPRENISRSLLDDRKWICRDRCHRSRRSKKLEQYQGRITVRWRSLLLFSLSPQLSSSEENSSFYFFFFPSSLHSNRKPCSVAVTYSQRKVCVRRYRKLCNNKSDACSIINPLPPSSLPLPPPRTPDLWNNDAAFCKWWPSIRKTTLGKTILVRMSHKSFLLLITATDQREFDLLYRKHHYCEINSMSYRSVEKFRWG